MDRDYDSCDDVEGVYERCCNFFNENKGSQTSHYGYEDDVRYKTFSHISYDHLEEGYARRRGSEVWYPSLFCATSYTYQSGIDVWLRTIRRCCMNHQRGTFSTSSDARTYKSCPNMYSVYSNDLWGRVRGSMSYKSKENSLF